MRHRHHGRHQEQLSLWVWLSLLSVCLGPLLTYDKLGAQQQQGDVIQLAEQMVNAQERGWLRVDLQFPVGYHLNPKAPLRYDLHVEGNGIDVAEADRQFRGIAPSLPLEIPYRAAAGGHRALLDLDMTFAYCREDDAGVCAIQSVRWRVPLRTTSSSVPGQPTVTYLAEVPVLLKPF